MRTHGVLDVGWKLAVFQPRGLEPDLGASSGAEAQVQGKKEPQILSRDPFLLWGVKKSQLPGKPGCTESITPNLST